ncbi:hypothetical protein ACIOKD_22540 [Streptomyces sp. NPDC087844]|uniref:hypothetical protein n=1 Tax=Streptomyces sp. NPDC087844 TaxID=3365805 RepID=UPI003826B5D6
MSHSSFEADPNLTRRGAEVLANIAEHAHALVNDLAHHRSALSGWAGQGDDYAQQVGPQIRTTYKRTLNSGRQITDAIVAVVDNTAGSARHVEKARTEAVDGIVDAQAAYDGRH